MILTRHFKVRCRPLRSSDPIGNFTDVAISILRLHRVDDEVAAGLDVDPAVHAGNPGDWDVVPVPGHGEVARGALPLAHEAHHVALRLVLVEGRVGDDCPACNSLYQILPFKIESIFYPTADF